jgi:hypothetical protein
VQFVQQHQRQDLAHAGNALQPVIGLHVVHLGGAGQVELGFTDQFIELVG